MFQHSHEMHCALNALHMRKKRKWIKNTAEIYKFKADRQAKPCPMVPKQGTKVEKQFALKDGQLQTQSEHHKRLECQFGKAQRDQFRGCRT